MTIVEGFSRFVGKSGTRDLVLSTNDKLEIFKMRNNQLDAYEYRNSKYFLLIQPPGSGKSVSIAFCMGDRLLNNPKEKVLIVVPQKMIAKTFSKMVLEYEDGTTLNWDIFYNLCQESNIKKTDELIRFLKEKEFGDEITERVGITTHLALSNIYKRISDIDDIFENTTIVIDEAHHVMYSNDNDNENMVNQIGKIVKHIDKNDKNSALWLVTATPYRGDNNSILPKEIFNKFDKHFLPLDKHWEENIKYIENFSFNFVTYKRNEVLNEVRNVLKLGKRKSIIFCPFNGQLLEKGDKRSFRDLLIQTIRKEWSDCRILDLIETNGRDKRKEILLDNEDAQHVDIILTLKIFDEGSDWVHAEQCIDLNPSNTLRLQYQRFGRLWRDYFRKHSIYYYMFLPYEADFEDDEKRRLHLSKMYNIFVVSLLLEEIVEPIKYPAKVSGNNSLYINPFDEAVPDDGDRQEIMKRIIDDLMIMRNYNNNPNPEEVKNCIGNVLEFNNISENQDEIINHIARILRRNSDKTNQVRKNPDWSNAVNFDWLIDAGFDQIWSNEILYSILSFGTGTCGISSFKEFRNILSERTFLDEWVEIAEHLSKNNNDKIPSFSKLTDMELHGLCIQLVRNPNKFSHLEREKERIYVDEWVEIAEHLAKNNNDKLPAKKVLKQEGYQQLISSIYKHKKKFNHICQEELRTRRSTSEWLVIARKRAKDNHGKLPSQKILKKEGLETMIKHFDKELFKGVKYEIETSRGVLIGYRIAGDQKKILYKY